MQMPPLKSSRSQSLSRESPPTMFAVDDLQGEYERLQGLGVAFTVEPTDYGAYSIAVFEDTCGNLIQIAQQ